jgi:hypothetical protein
LRELTRPGLKFPEGPRRRDDSWWVSDQLGGTVHRIDGDGRYECVLEVAGRDLLLRSAETNRDDDFVGRSVGHLDLVRVDVAAVQCP